MSRQELLAKYPELDRDIHRPNAEADAIVALALTGHKVVHRRIETDVAVEFVVVGHTVYSPDARNHPRISDAIDEAKVQKRTVPEPDDLGGLAAIDYAHSNLADRTRLSYDPDGHDLDQVYPIGSRADRQEIAASLSAASMGVPGTSVVLSDPNVPHLTPDLPLRWRREDGSANSSVAVFPVAHGFSVQRTAELLLHFLASQCRWCDRARGRPEWGLLCSAGETVYLFPACFMCKDELASDFADGDHGSTQSLDFVANDGDLHGTGWPADRHR